MNDEPDAQARSSDRDSVQVIARAASVLRAVAANPSGLSLAEIAREAGLARSTIQRIVRSLEAEEFLETGIRRGYVIGRGLQALASGAGLDVAAVAQPFLRELATQVDETVDLSVIRGSVATFVGHIAGAHRLAALSAIGMEFPLHSTANGKALLAALPPDRWDAMLPEILPADTANTITDPAALHAQLRQLARSGITYDIEEHTEGVCAVGTAFLDRTGTPYAISVPVPRQRFDQKVALLEEPLLECRARIVEAVGGSLPG